MYGLQGLADSVKNIVQQRIDNESRAIKGVMKDGQFVSGNKSYPAKQAVDVDVSNGSIVWAQLDRNGNAIIVGS